MIDLGLARMVALLKHTYPSNVEGHPYRRHERKRNNEYGLSAGDFELLTATVFEIFESEKVEIGVIEGGLDGWSDATDALKHNSITVIAKIGLDHPSPLGKPSKASSIVNLSHTNGGICSGHMRHFTLPSITCNVNIEKVTGRTELILLDSAHDLECAEVLLDSVAKRLRVHGKSVTWVLATSVGKDLSKVAKVLLRNRNNVVAVEFEPVNGMPRVKPMNSPAILEAVRKIKASIVSKRYAQADLTTALKRISQISNGGPLVVAGSLHLLTDCLRLLRP
ncbi:folylpolyglutamate synthase-like protein [Xylaria sp. CBS 124048]|nr:folylpolyglutamate synthase-like protein [Xylaria sp. CBS 124048]